VWAWLANPAAVVGAVLAAIGASGN
jgi:hypothetical protein